MSRLLDTERLGLVGVANKEKAIRNVLATVEAQVLLAKRGRSTLGPRGPSR